MNEEKEPPLTMTIGEYHWKRGSDGRYVMQDGFAGSRYQCGVTESLLVERLAAAQDKISRMKMQSATESAAVLGSLEWIPVTERLPERNTPVLVFTSGVVTEMEWDGYGWYHGANEVWEGVHAVTHWMPLPAPPTDAK